MKVALASNTAWLDEELVWFEQLTVGMVSESIGVVQVVPEVLGEQVQSNFADSVFWQETRPGWWNRWRMTRAAEALTAHKVDVLHALDGRLWPGVVRLGQMLELPVVLNAGSKLDVQTFKKVARRLASLPGVCLVPLSDAAERQLEPLMSTIKSESVWSQAVVRGVHVDPAAAPRPRGNGDPVCVVVSGNGRLDAHYEAVLNAIAQVVRRFDQAQFFFDGMHDDQQEIYRLARRLGLLPHVSFTPRQLGHREVLLGADVLVHPQPLGRSRGLLLQAMAHGMLVIAQADPWADGLIHNQTAWVVEKPDAAAWTQQLNQAIGQADAAEALGQQALDWVREHRRMSDTVDQFIEVYDKIAGRTLAFNAPTPAPGSSAGK